MTPSKNYLLTCLAEECAEVVHAVMKHKRFGNAEDKIDSEVMDVMSILSLLHDLHGWDLPTDDLDGLSNAKLKKIKKFMKRGNHRDSV